jgi:hypothetical protein
MDLKEAFESSEGVLMGSNVLLEVLHLPLGGFLDLLDLDNGGLRHGRNLLLSAINKTIPCVG